MLALISTQISRNTRFSIVQSTDFEACVGADLLDKGRVVYEVDVELNASYSVGQGQREILRYRSACTFWILTVTLLLEFCKPRFVVFIAWGRLNSPVAAESLDVDHSGLKDVV